MFAFEADIRTRHRHCRDAARHAGALITLRASRRKLSVQPVAENLDVHDRVGCRRQGLRLVALEEDEAVSLGAALAY